MLEKWGQDPKAGSNTWPGTKDAKHRAPTEGWSRPFRLLVPDPFFGHAAGSSLSTETRGHRRKDFGMDFGH